MTDHLHLADLGFEAQCAALERIVRENSDLMGILEILRDTRLPDVFVGGGAIYQTAWNSLTGRQPWQGIKDIDILYFDASDLSWEAEDRVIRRLEALLPEPPVPIEVRNQARVHLWYAQRFGFAIPPLQSSGAALLRYAARCHAVAVRLNADDGLHIEAPFGLDDLFAFRIAPNLRNGSRGTYEEKGGRAQSHWPELTVLPWPTV